MTMENTLSRLDSVLVNSPPVSFDRTSQSWGWSTRLLVGGLIVASLIGWAQGVHRVAVIRAELGPDPVVVITKEEAWLRIHPRLRPQSLPAAVDLQAISR
jgi:hypothetical protein